MLNSKYSVLVLTCLAIALNLALLLIPSIVMGVPNLVLTDKRLAVFLLIVSIWMIVEAWVGRNRLRSKNLPQVNHWLPVFMSAAMLCVFLASLTEQALNGMQPFTILSTVGCLAMISGVVLRYLAIHTLGTYFLDDVTVLSGQPLVTTGIYKYLRHPSETGNLGIAFGSSLLAGSILGLLICTLAVLPLVLMRIRQEDHLLMRHYSASFVSYREAVPALFPRIRL